MTAERDDRATPPGADVEEIDLARRKWLDPKDASRFTRKPLAVTDGASSEETLQNIARLTDEIFGHLSVLEQYSETTSRGAVSRGDAQRLTGGEQAGLLAAERELFAIYASLAETRRAFVARQLASLNADGRDPVLKLHIGSANCLVQGWVNIDAGGADLALNVTWGLPFADDSAAFVYSSHVLEHLRYGDQAPVFIREVLRVLRPGGVVRFVVPDIRKLLTAYVQNDADYFSDRGKFYPLSDGFMNGAAANLDYVLLYSGAGPQTLNYNHKFGYDAHTLCKLLTDAGFTSAEVSDFQASAHPDLRIDDHGFDACVADRNGDHYSLFVEAAK